MKEYQIQEAFCSKLRLLIISHLITKKLLFTELKKLTNASDGNLSIQLKKLESWEYVKSEKKLMNGKAVTQYEIRWNETPGKKMILAGLSSITEELSGNFLYNSLLGDHNITTELLHRLMEQTIEPVVRGYLKKPEETDSIYPDE